MKSAFTLSEVLLVLSVIGVVAALTIPTLIQRISNDQYISKLKKGYSVLGQSYTMLMADNGGVITGNVFTGGNAMVLNAFAPKLNIIKNCGVAAGCHPTTPLYSVNKTQISSSMETGIVGAKAVLADGTVVTFEDFTGDCNLNKGSGALANTCGFVTMDMSGFVAPNAAGRDIFGFYLTQDGVYPAGSNGDTVYSCNTAGTTMTTSLGCTAKVLTENAMTY